MKSFLLALGAAAALASSPAAGAGTQWRFEPTLDASHHDLEVRIQPEKHRLEGRDRISFEADGRGEYFFYLGDVFEVSRARLDGRRVELKRIEIESPKQHGQARGNVGETGPESLRPPNRTLYGVPAAEPGEHVLEIDYSGVVDDTLRVPEGSRSGIPSETDGLIDTSGTYLAGWSTGWYPDGEDDYARFSIRVTTPPGVEAVTEGKLARVRRTRNRTVVDWEVGYPTQHVTLMAANYVVRQRDAGGVALMAYFFPSEEDLIDTYLGASEKYIELYNKLIGPYPFSKFAVVENFFPTGYGMPSYTLLGRRIVRMPFIVQTSLGHEVAHNWWGNCVYPDLESGNWCEGLTTYYADYRYEAEKGDSAASVYRRDILVDYATHVTDSTDIALSDFQSREDDITGVVGYGKCMMVFHMLRNHVGEDKFYRAMRNFFLQNRFEVAGWEDIETALEEASGEPLDGFFDQWVLRPGAPRLSLGEVRLERAAEAEERYTVNVTLRNEGGYVLYRVPVDITGPSVTRRIAVDVTGPTLEFDWHLDERPVRLAVDPDCEIFRRLSPVEIPVTIDRALAGDSALVVLPGRASAEAAAAYAELGARLSGGEGTVVAYDSTLTAHDLASRSVIVLGARRENGVWRWLDLPAGTDLDGGELVVDGRRYARPGNAAFVAFVNTVDSTQTACAIVGNSAAAVRAAGYKVIYYGKYSYVTFLDGVKQVAGVFAPPPGPLEYTFAVPDSVTEPQ